MEALANATVVIILQYIGVSVQHLKFTQCYNADYISIKLGAAGWGKLYLLKNI